MGTFPHTLQFDRLDVAGAVLPLAERLAAAGGRQLLLNAHPVDWKLHLRNQRGAVPTENLLEGDLDFTEVMEALHGFGGWLTLELWHPESTQPASSMAESTRRSAGLLRRLGSEPAVLFRAGDGFVTDDDRA